jgi:hypothetical protein
MEIQMGYTHYFQQSKSVSDEQWEKITTDANKIISTVKQQHISLISDDDNGIMVNEKRINLNGVGSDSHETFYLPKHDTSFQFCKTARKPYDLAVCAILLVAHEHAPGAYDISSDGEDEDWAEAMNFNAKTLGYAYHLPPEISSSTSPALEAQAYDIATRFQANNNNSNSASDSQKEVFTKNKNRYNI